jgi:hypothetical protein
MYYKKFENKVYTKTAALAEIYKSLKGKNGVIVSNNDNGEFLLVPTEMVGEFVPITVSREDLDEIGFDSKLLTDEEMAQIAEGMGDDWAEGDFWEDLESNIELVANKW